MSAAHERLAGVIRERAGRDGVAIVPFVTAGFPSLGALAGLIAALEPHAAAIEVGVPFSDPMADGMTIQASSRAALAAGATPRWVLEELGRVRAGKAGAGGAPIVLMSYVNPLLALGGDLAALCEAAGVAGVIIPDLPMEEAGPVRSALNARGVGLVMMATPMSDAGRLGELAAATQGYLYAVTRTGVTGSAAATGKTDAREDEELHAYLARCREACARSSGVPVCAGFGIRGAADVRRLAGHAHGAIVGSALVEVIGRGGDAGAFVAGLAAPAAR